MNFPTVDSFKTENGAQVLARLVPKPLLTDLLPEYFCQQLNNTDIIELHGKESTDKWRFLIEFVSAVVLPPSWQDIALGGVSRDVVFVDTGHRFDVIHLVSCMEQRVRSAAAKSGTRRLRSSEIEPLITECLKKVHVFQCSTSNEFYATLATLEPLVARNENVAAVIVDSMTAFYWSVRAELDNDFKKLNVHYKQIAKIIHKVCKDYRVCFLLTVQALISRQEEDCKVVLHSASEGGAGPEEFFHVLGHDFGRLASWRLYLGRSCSELNKGEILLRKRNGGFKNTVEFGVDKHGLFCLNN